MDLAAVAAELYALPPSEFTAARNARAKAAKAEGEALLAKQVARLPKPSVSAWCVDALVRTRPAELAPVLELGAALREAQDSLDAARMRELGEQRMDVIAEAVRSAREAAEEQSVAVSEAAAGEVEQTLRAAMADPQAGDAVRRGLLVRSLVSNGWEPVDLDGAVAVPGAIPAPAPTAQSGAAGKSAEVARTPRQNGDAAPQAEDEAAAHRRRAEAEAALARERAGAEAELTEAEQRLESARAELKEAREQVAAASERRDRLEGEREDLRRRLERLEQELEAADREEGLAGRAQRLAARVAEQEERAVDRARERVERLR
ncbi:hypothetical protein GCM10012320_00190 [Sinomonas cellulolyticus]|uniref:Transposase n=1 Tax=Sinomonas cellulolyticus TaxID=2801916 RepID=A0ABS1K0F0_9MICC|nr:MULTISPECIES: hypothetical protein [Sinomonas]MBL0705139.1 hypothetical protein [Sinomonas cellulolyticus]GHG39495.1 hypothetical protein GCM10012320_00190 [Sinomonas sp. KCTC 49339]